MAESELLCVRVATLLRNKYASTSSVMSEQVVRIVKKKFIVLYIFLALTAPWKKHIDIALAINLVKTRY